MEEREPVYRIAERVRGRRPRVKTIVWMAFIAMVSLAPWVNGFVPGIL